MENKRYLLIIGLMLFVILLISVNRVLAFGNSSSTPSSVTDFYQGMLKLAETYDSNYANDVIGMMKKCFFNAEEGSGIDLPNDFRFFDYDKKSISHEDANQNSSNYVEKLYDYIFKDKVLTVNYKIQKSEDIGSAPEYKNRKELSMSTSLVATYVEKVYYLNGKAKVYNDTVITEFTSGKISEIRNGYGRIVVNVTTLRNRASIAYRLGNYREAYECYEKIVAMAPNDDDALYRLGLMTYFQKGCEFPSKSKARKKGVEYMKRANTAAKWSSNIRSKSENVLNKLIYPNQ